MVLQEDEDGLRVKLAVVRGEQPAIDWSVLEDIFRDIERAYSSNGSCINPPEPCHACLPAHAPCCMLCCVCVPAWDRRGAAAFCKGTEGDMSEEEELTRPRLPPTTGTGSARRLFAPFYAGA